MDTLRYKTEDGQPPFRGIPPAHWHQHGITDSPVTATPIAPPPDEPPFGGNVAAYLEHKKQQEQGQSTTTYATIDLSSIYGGGQGGCPGVFYDPSTGRVFSTGNFNAPVSAPAPVIQVQAIATTTTAAPTTIPAPINYNNSTSNTLPSSSIPAPINYNNPPTTTTTTTAVLPKLSTAKSISKLNFIAGTLAPWDNPGQTFSWQPLSAPTSLKIKDLIPQICPLMGPDGKPLASSGVAEVLEGGDGKWLKSTEYWIGKKAKDDAVMQRRVEQTLGEVGWNENRGTDGSRPVWLVAIVEYAD